MHGLHKASVLRRDKVEKKDAGLRVHAKEIIEIIDSHIISMEIYHM